MVRLIIWIAIGLLILSFFGISLRHLVESPTNQDNLSFLWQMLGNGWHILAAWANAFVAWVTHIFDFASLRSIQPTN